MKAFIIGANGRTGTELIDLALARGHEVSAYVRSPHKITRSHARLRVIPGNPRDSHALSRALPGHDVVFSALGIRAREIFSPVSLLQECAATTVAAMTRSAVSRLVFVSAATLFPSTELRFKVVRTILTHQVQDLVAAEQIIRATDLAWTIARPPRLVSNASAAYRAERAQLPAYAWSMSFRAVAAFMWDAAEQQSHLREVVGLAS